MMRSHRALAGVVCLAGLFGGLLVAQSAGPAYASRLPGAPRQLDGGGCLTDQRTDRRIGCARIRAFRGPGGRVVFSSDGRFAYVGASDAILAFRRSRATGRLTQLAGAAGCITRTGRQGCRRWPLLFGGSEGLAITPDGRSVFLAGLGVRAFRRDRRTGELRPVAGPVGCLGVSAPGCVPLRGPEYRSDYLQSTGDIAVSSDGRNVYVLGATSGIAVLAVDRASGGLVQLDGPAGCLGGIGGCLPSPNDASFLFSSLAISPDDAFVYTTSDSLVLRRDRNTGALAFASTPDFRLDDATPSGLALSAGGRQAYMADGVVGLLTLARDPSSGALVRPTNAASCLADLSSVQFRPTCKRAFGLVGGGPYSIALSPDDRFLYAAAEGGGFKDGTAPSPEGFGISAFARHPGDGSLRQLPGHAGCLVTYTTPECGMTAQRILLPQISIAPDGRNAYVVSNGSDNGLMTIFALAR